MKMSGKVPLSAPIFVRSHLRTAAMEIGVPIVEGQRFGLHNLRHSPSNRLVKKRKLNPKLQGILRHAGIQTTLDLNTQQKGDETRAAQGQFLKALGMPMELAL